ncbi:MAG: hypothetical protein FWG39_04195 [Alphaproteobacteria bacterium]|nr:hypothetical protein [Alphaproteobacteria bacterium]
MTEKEKKAIIGKCKAKPFKIVKITEKQKDEIIVKAVAKIIKNRRARDNIWRVLANELCQSVVGCYTVVK